MIDLTKLKQIEDLKIERNNLKSKKNKFIDRHLKLLAEHASDTFYAYFIQRNFNITHYEDKVNPVASYHDAVITLRNDRNDEQEYYFDEYLLELEDKIYSIAIVMEDSKEYESTFKRSDVNENNFDIDIYKLRDEIFKLNQFLESLHSKEFYYVYNENNDPVQIEHFYKEQDFNKILNKIAS